MRIEHGLVSGPAHLMYEHETFPKAPITEALIDLRAEYDREITIDEINQLAGKLSERFPNQQDRTQFRQALKFETTTKDTETSTRSKIVAKILFSKDKKKALQLRLDGFAFSKMRPYESWDSLRHEACECWEAYCDALGPSRVERLAVRYINRIELPLPISSFQDYILTGPQVAADLPQGLAEFFFRVVIPNPENSQIRAIVTSTMENPEEEGGILPYIFDIDVFMPVCLDPTSDDIWTNLEKLRTYKNEIFFLSLTEKAKELFR